MDQFYQFIKAAITSPISNQVKSGKRILDTSDKATPAWKKSKSDGVNSQAAKSPGRRSKVPRRQLEADQESLSPSLLWRKL